jgi:hypothetical protein
MLLIWWAREPRLYIRVVVAGSPRLLQGNDPISSMLVTSTGQYNTGYLLLVTRH